MQLPLEERWYELGFALRLSSHYHQERRRFFTRWDNVALLASLLLSSGAAVALRVDNCAHSETALWLSFGVAILQGASLVIGFGKKACQHQDYLRRFIDLENRHSRTPASEEACTALNVDRRELEKDEPTPMPYLTTRCQIDLMRREGFPRGDWPRLHWVKRFLAQYLPEVG